MMKSLSELDSTKVQFVFCDIDDTLTEAGKLLPESFSAMWELFRRGLHIVPVTGRPAGWCELIARQWPVAGVIGENGGFYFRLVNNEMVRHFSIPQSTRVDNQKRLERIRAEVLASVPGTKVASDQFCRMMDLAIDFAEDVVPPLPMYAAENIVQIFKKHGAVAKISSIHVNGWFGDYNKLSCCQDFLEREFKLNFSEAQAAAIFIGDSPNDEPMFEAFQKSVAVANIHRFKDVLKHFPKYVTTSQGGLGFAELAHHIIQTR
jgi:HAD superfamily hydrolase (TIGR01484 family)